MYCVSKRGWRDHKRQGEGPQETGVGATRDRGGGHKRQGWGPQETGVGATRDRGGATRDRGGGHKRQGWGPQETGEGPQETGEGPQETGEGPKSLYLLWDNFVSDYTNLYLYMYEWCITTDFI